MEKVQISFLQRFFINLTGHDIETVENTTSAEKTRIVTMGVSLLVPIIFGTLSGGYTAYLFIHSPWAYAVGLAWGTVVYLIDRVLLSMTSQNVLGYVMRLLMAVLIGLAVSLPLKLKIFEDAIVEELQGQNQEKMNQIQQKYQPKLDAIDADLHRKEAMLEGQRKTWEVEMDGSGGTKKRGIGIIARTKGTEYRKAQQDFDAYRTAKLNEKESLTHTTKVEIQSMSLASANGFMGQYKALGRVSEKEPFIKMAAYIIWALFTLIELIPLLVKITSRDNLYDNVVALNNKAKLVSTDNVNTLKIEADTLAQSKLIHAKMNNIKLATATNDVDTQAKMAEMYVQKLMELAKNENKKVKEILKMENLTKEQQETLLENIAKIMDHHSNNIYKAPFEKEELFDLL